MQLPQGRARCSILVPMVLPVTPTSKRFSPPPLSAGLRTVVVCDWIPPAFGAVGQYMEQRAVQLCDSGANVELIGLGDANSSETHSQGPGTLTRTRIHAPANPKHSYLMRAFWTLRVNVLLVLATGNAIKGWKKCDIVVTGSPPFLSYIFVVLNLAIWRRRLIYRITDFYPETILATGAMPWFKLLSPLFERLRRAASLVEVLGEDQRRRLSENGMASAQIRLVRDRSPIDSWAGASAAPRPFPEDEVLLLYSGNMGTAHEVETFCAAYRRHVETGSNRVRLWINGTGKGIGAVRAYCEAHRLPLHVTPPAPLTSLPGILLAADAHLVLLGDPFWGYVLPSKIYACLESRRPIFYVGPAESDVHLLAQRHASEYWHGTQGDVEGCLNALESLASRPRDGVSPGATIDFDDLAAPARVRNCEKSA